MGVSPVFSVARADGRDAHPTLWQPAEVPQKVSFDFPGRSQLWFYVLSPHSAPRHPATGLAGLPPGRIPIDISREELAGSHGIDPRPRPHQSFWRAEECLRKRIRSAVCQFLPKRMRTRPDHRSGPVCLCSQEDRPDNGVVPRKTRRQPRPFCPPRTTSRPECNIRGGVVSRFRCEADRLTVLSDPEPERQEPKQEPNLWRISIASAEIKLNPRSSKGSVSASERLARFHGARQTASKLLKLRR